MRNYLLEATNAITEFTNKVNKSVSINLNKYNQNIANKYSKIHFDTLAQKIKSSDAVMPIVCLIYNMNMFKALQIIPFDYDKMKAFRNEKDFVKEFYPNYYSEDMKFKDKLVDVIKTESKINFNSSTAMNWYDYLANGYKMTYSIIERDSKTLIDSMKKANNVAQSVSQESTIDSEVMYNQAIRSLVEMDESDQDDMSVKSSKDKGSSFIKVLKTYTSVSSTILMVKMDLGVEIYDYYCKMLRSY